MVGIGWETKAMVLSESEFVKRWQPKLQGNHAIYGQYGGYLVFMPESGGQVYRVPFAGFADDRQNIKGGQTPC